MDVALFFHKWLTDVRDAQLDNGAFTDVAPDPGFIEWLKIHNANLRGYGTAGWGNAGIIVPWTLYQMYGDRRLLEIQYPAMLRWVKFLRGEARDYVQSGAFGYGDWLSIDADTPLQVLATAYFAHSVYLTMHTAMVLGKSRDASELKDLFQRIRGAFQSAFVAENGVILGETQTAYVLALYMDLLEPNQQSKAIQHLVADIERRGDRLSTGFLGVRYLLPVLSQNGRLAVAYRLLCQTLFPSWLYPVLQGATTIWELGMGGRNTRGFRIPA